MYSLKPSDTINLWVATSPRKQGQDGPGPRVCAPVRRLGATVRRLLKPRLRRPEDLLQPKKPETQPTDVPPEDDDDKAKKGKKKPSGEDVSRPSARTPSNRWCAVACC